MKQQTLFADILPQTTKVIVAGHRGIDALYPENTLFSFQKAFDAGVDMIEFDINMTKDGVLVVIHDNSVDRTTDGTGLVCDYTLEQLKQLDAGSHKGEEFRGFSIPTLRELLDLCRAYPKMLFNVEIKDYRDEVVDKTIAMLDEYGLHDRCVMACFSAQVICHIKEVSSYRVQGFPLTRLLHVSSDIYEKMDSVGIHLSMLEENLVADFTARGMESWAYCVNDTEWARKVLDYDVPLITCDNPIPALELYREMGLR